MFFSFIKVWGLQVAWLSLLEAKEASSNNYILAKTTQVKNTNIGTE